MDHVWSNPQQKGKHRGTSCPWSSWHHLQLLHPWAPLGLALGVSVWHINPGYLSKKIQMNSTSMYLTQLVSFFYLMYIHMGWLLFLFTNTHIYIYGQQTNYTHTSVWPWWTFCSSCLVPGTLYAWWWTARLGAASPVFCAAARCCWRRQSSTTTRAHGCICRKGYEGRMTLDHLNGPPSPLHILYQST